MKPIIKFLISIFFIISLVLISTAYDFDPARNITLRDLYSIVDGVSGEFATLNTGQGDNELYAMNQDVETTDNVTFIDVCIGGSCIEGDLVGNSWSDPVNSNIIPDTDNTYDLGNSTKEFKDAYFDGTVTTDIISCSGAITGATLDTGQGANELYAMNQNVQTTNAVTFDNATISTNTTVQEIRFESDTNNHYINDNATCIIINGDTSQLRIC